MDPSYLLNCNPDLVVERQKATFDLGKLAAFFWGTWGTADKVERRKAIADYIEQCGDELRPTKPIAFMSREEHMETSARLCTAMLKHAGNAIDVSNPEELFYFNSLICGIDGSPLNLHFIMVIPAFTNNADDDQKAEWLPKLFSLQVIATYAQTEMGHGTNLSKLETTATYDREKEEFVMDTPTITATKWWPGNLGKSSNYAIVVANLFIHGKSYGPHLFWVQLRDLETHNPLPGIKVGDIGPKFGINSIDNGFLRFEKVRIQRRQMLMRHAKVLPNGEYVRPRNPKANFSTMMYIRSVMIHDQSMCLAKACTIAIRYSCVRRQGEIHPNAGEVKVLDYQTQQYRLLPQLARVFAMFLAGSYIRKMYYKVISNVIAVGDSSLIQDCHGLSSGLKSVCSFQTALGIEQCRMACGGHGYSQASGLPHLYTVAVGGCTYEGENIVMLLQTARYLMKWAKAALSTSKADEEKPGPIISYLFERGPTNSPLREEFDPQIMCLAFEYLSRHLIFKAFTGIEALKMNGRTPEEAWNEMSTDLMKVY